jgi:hypothetical protein
LFHEDRRDREYRVIMAVTARAAIRQAVKKDICPDRERSKR